MSKQFSISKNKPKSLSQDYEKLRLFGIKYIEQFSKDIWTDYNVHDPGITVMEILNYVITDLGYRTSLPMEDILARSGTDITKDFFTAREILPCNPVTFDDLRKKIIDVEGVENAWVLPYTDEVCATTIKNPAYYIKCRTTDPINIQLNAEPQVGFEKRNINGLYKFNLMLEEDAVLGDLNILSVDSDLINNGNGSRKALVRFVFPMNTEKTYPGKDSVITDLEKFDSGVITDYNILNFDNASNSFDLELICSTGTVFIPKVTFQIQPVHTNENLSGLKTALKDYLIPSSPSTAAKNKVIAKIFSVFGAKVKKISTIIDEVYCMYQHVRNLCEDVIKIGLVPSQEIAVCADIETDGAVDLEEILGKIYFYIDTFFSPPVRFYLLHELLTKGIPTENIFEGPLLKHGFILDEDLQRASLFSEIHVSDLYNLIMGIEGVKTIKYLQITNYYNGQPFTEGDFWKLVLKENKILSSTLPTDSFHLNLDRFRSKIIFYKGDMPITADKQVANRIYNDLKATLSKPRLNPSLKILNDILPPAGTNYQLEEYYSLQNEFPHIYGVNRDGIPSNTDMIHKTKIKQLKGYLLFFDQLLTNYLSQLAQVKNLYSIGNNENQTYFSQPVYDTPNPTAEDDNFYSNPSVDAVMPDSETLSFYGTAPLLKDFVIPTSADIDNSDSYMTQWKTFANGKKNNYRIALNELTEPYDDKLKRRNRFLDHLLSRFAENFSDFAAKMYKFTGNVLESRNKKTAEEIASDKLVFLQNYHILSYNRGKGQYYKCCPSGNCDAAPIKPSSPPLEYILEPGLPIAPSTARNFKFSLKWDSGYSLTSVNFYQGPTGASAVGMTIEEIEEEARRKAFMAMEKLRALITDEDNPNTDNIYFEAVPFGGGFRIEVKETPSAIVPYAVSSPLYVTNALAIQAIQKLKYAFSSLFENVEYDSYNTPKPSNADGLQMRTSMMLGMNITDNSNLAIGKYSFIQSPAIPPSLAHTFNFSVKFDGMHFLTSVNAYEGSTGADAVGKTIPEIEEEAKRKASSAMEKLAALATDEDNSDTGNIYFETRAFGGGFRIEVKETILSVTPYAVSSPVYPTQLLAQKGVTKLKRVFFDEGMHIIENLLLRPLPVNTSISSTDLKQGFFPLCAELNPDCDCPITDYYSFRINVVLPYWTNRFRNMDFRAFAEDTIHRETPAHILPRFCWVSMYDMLRLEEAYTDWFTENKKYKPRMNILREKLKKLIKVLNTLTNIYPEGHLHDCDNPSTDNPVILNQTNLGTF